MKGTEEMLATTLRWLDAPSLDQLRAVAETAHGRAVLGQDVAELAASNQLLKAIQAEEARRGFVATPGALQ